MARQLRVEAAGGAEDCLGYVNAVRVLTVR